MSEFDALLAELQAVQTNNADLAKGLKAADEAEGGGADKIAAAADEGAGKDKDGDGKDDDGEEDEFLGKSFRVKLEDGTESDAFDGTEAIKRLADAARAERASRTDMAKALTAALGALKGQGELLAQQGQMLKSMHATLQSIGSQGAGRKAVLSVVEKQPQTPGPKQAEGITRGELMAKALTAQTKGVITSRDIARIEGRLNNGEEVPRDLIARIMAA